MEEEPNHKRYIITMDLYIYEENKIEALDKAEQLARIFDNCGDLKAGDWYTDDFLKENHDNKCCVVSVDK